MFELPAKKLLSALLELPFVSRNGILTWLGNETAIENGGCEAKLGYQVSSAISWKNTPMPPRTLVLPFLKGSQLNPIRGAKLSFGGLYHGAPTVGVAQL